MFFFRRGSRQSKQVQGQYFSCSFSHFFVLFSMPFHVMMSFYVIQTISSALGRLRYVTEAFSGYLHIFIDLAIIKRIYIIYLVRLERLLLAII